MNYHISTGLILQEFNKNSECPLCQIKAIVERNIVEQFLNDAVMEDDTRNKVNRLGFCCQHYDMLFASQNKLSLALQSETRIKTIKKEITLAKTAKQAKKQLENLQKLTSSCIICDIIDGHMTRYYKTVAEMYQNEKEFPKMLTSTNGFCLKHFEGLLNYSSYAGFKTKDYLKDLNELENSNIERLLSELQWFCDKHDYRNREKPIGVSADILPRLRTKLYGKKNS